MWRWVIAAGLALTITFARGAAATSVRPLTTRQLTESAARVVVARCVSVETRGVPAYGGQLFTFSTFETRDRIAGAIGDRFTLRLFGGRQGDVVVDAPMMPTFTPGEDVLLLLGPDNADGHPVVRIQGVLRIETDARTGAPVVTTPVSGLDIQRATDGAGYAVPPTPVPLDDLVFTLRRLRQHPQDQPKKELHP